jgi:hypothetical protein
MDYILVEREEFDSRLNPGARSWRLTFYSVDDGTFWEMTVDSTYRNYRKSGWDHVVRDDNPWASYADLQRTDRQATSGFPIVSADSPARINHRFESRDQALKIMQLDYEQRHPEPTRFGSLFE